MDKQSVWWQSFYEETPFEIVFARHNKEELDAIVDFVIDKLEIETPSLIFDQCCGHGTLSQAIAERGHAVIGVDLCEKFINLAKQNCQGLNANFKQDDAFKFLPEQACDGAINWYTSFGYACDDNTNIQMLKRAYESLKFGGVFLLDCPNTLCLLQNFQEKMVRKQQTDQGEITLERNCRIDKDQSLMEQTWTYTLSDGKQLVKHSQLKLYSPEQLVGFFQKCGFSDIELYGNYKGQPLSPERERCIVRGRR